MEEYTATHKANNNFMVFEAIALGIIFGIGLIAGLIYHDKKLDAITQTIAITGEVTDLQYHYDAESSADGITGMGDMYYAQMISDGKEFIVTIDQEDYETLKVGDDITVNFSYYRDEEGRTYFRSCSIQD